MAASQDFQNTRGTVVATFTQTGTYSAPIDLGGGWLVGCYSDNFPSAAGSLLFRSSWSQSGTGYPVQTLDGTVLKVLSFGSGTFYSLGHAPWNTAPLQYVTIQIGTAGTAAVAGGGTIVLITGI
jgi:hypothetical protein